MKYLPVTLLIGALALALHAQTPPPKPDGDPFVKGSGDAAAGGAKPAEKPGNILIVFEAYSMNRSDAAALLETEANGAARYRRVLDLTKAGQARLQTLSSIVTKGGQRAVVEAIDQVRFASEFAPPVAAKDLPTPSAWETHNAGDTFEVEPVASPDGHYCDLNLVPARTTLAKFSDAESSPNDTATSLPIFNDQKITTAVTTEEGVPFYLGTFTPPPAQGIANNAGADEVWLAFLHVSVQKAPVPTAPSPIKLEVPVAVDLEYSCYSLDRQAASEILAPTPSTGVVWDKVRALSGDKKAKLEFITSLRTKSGQRAAVGETQEVRYTTEYIPATRASTQETSSTVSDKDVKSTTTTKHIAANAERIPGFGTAFESRDAGITVQVEPVIQPDQLTIDLNQEVANIRYLGTLKVPGAGAQYPPQPLFQTSKVATSELVLSGQHTLLGTFNPPGADGVNDHTDSGRTWLLFVNARVVAP